ncbi:MAG: peptidoglycan-binding protein [Candidatus Pacebacteria bacterium]|nr:peptidoglycan-binding protein [Candidatus Paceibacterota bacterium]
MQSIRLVFTTAFIFLCLFSFIQHAGTAYAAIDYGSLGYIDTATPKSDGTVSVQGWACIKNSPSPVSVQVYLGGPMGSGTLYGSKFVTSLWSEPAVAVQCQSTGVKYRFNITVDKTTVSANIGKKIYIYVVNTFTGENTAIINSGNFALTAVPSVPPTINCPATAIQGSTVTCNASVPSSILSTGRYWMVNGVAQLKQTSLTSYTWTQVPAGTFKVRFVGIDASSGKEVQSNEATVVISAIDHSSVGYIDTATPKPDGSVSVQGWACIKNSPSSVSVQMYLGGPMGIGTPYGGKIIAGLLSESAVAVQCQSTGKNYRFDITVDKATVSANIGKKIYIYVVNTFTGENTAIINSGNFALATTPLASCDQPQQLPLLTHYKTGVGFSLGGTDVPLLYNASAESKYVAGANNVPMYNVEFPSPNNYPANRYDDATYPDNDVKNMLAQVCAQTKVPYRLVQPGIVIRTSTDLQNILNQNQPHAQIIHLLVFRNNLFTIILPPNWNVQKLKYPLIIHGFYGINVNLMTETPPLLTLLGNLYSKDKLGAIEILWNGEGALASRTMNDRAYKDLNDFMGLAMTALHVNPSQIVAFGGSRGGVTALNIASNSEITNFNVRYVFAQAPPSEIDALSVLTGPTVPHLMSARDLDTGYLGSWANDFYTPSDSKLGGGLSGAQAHTKVLTGAINPTYLQQHFNLSGSEKVRNLLARKTEVSLEISSHDEIVAGVDQFSLFKTYQENNVPMETRINYLGGHKGWNQMSKLTRVMDTISNEVVYGVSRTSLITKNVVSPYLIASSGSLPTLYTKAQSKLPLTLEIPRYIHERVNPFFIATGVPYASYRMIFKDVNGVKRNIDFSLNNRGIWKAPVDTTSFTVGVNTLESVVALNAQGQPYETLSTLRTSLPMTGSLVMERFVGDLRPYGGRIESTIIAGYRGAQNENALRIGNAIAPVSNGLVEKIGEGTLFSQATASIIGDESSNSISMSRTCVDGVSCVATLAASALDVSNGSPQHTSGVTGGGVCMATKGQTLMKGSRGTEVLLLQKQLAQYPAIYPEGDMTGYFGPATERAVQRFQEKNGIVKSGSVLVTGYGAFGPQTRMALVQWCSAFSETPTVGISNV